MADYKYSFTEYNEEKMARSVGRDLPISVKHAIEICNSLRKKKLVRAKTMLKRVMEQKDPVPFKRFTNGVGHRKGNMASGRYPAKASKNILFILESAETNAQQKGLNTAQLEITHISAQKGSRPVKYGRFRGRKMKRTHIEVVLSESAEKPREKKTEKKAEEIKPDQDKKDAKTKHVKESSDPKGGEKK